MKATVLVMNCGSSSIKFQIFAMNANNEGKPHLKGMVEKIGLHESKLTIHDLQTDQRIAIEIESADHQQALALILKQISRTAINAVGHRVIHGGPFFDRAIILDDSSIAQIEQCIPLAPLHTPHVLTGIRTCMQLLPDIPHVASFDTAFHHNKPEVSYLFALPYDLLSKHNIRKYGFHGASHKYVSQRAAKILAKKPGELKLVTCHLGNGSTVTAVDAGIAVDTSATFGTMCGLPMGTRSGDFDPSLILHLMSLGYSQTDIYQMIYTQSGLLGISGVSSDMRELRQAAQQGNHRARLAIDMYVYAAKKFIGSFAAAMDGLDAIVFTAGIGENDNQLREEICSGLIWFGVEIDREANSVQGREAIISTPESKVKVLVIPTNEESMIAQEVMEAIALPYCPDSAMV